MRALIRTFVVALAAVTLNVAPVAARAYPTGDHGAYGHGGPGGWGHYGGRWGHPGGYWGRPGGRWGPPRGHWVRGGGGYWGRGWGGVGLGIGLGLGIGSVYYSAPWYPGYVVTVPTTPVYPAGVAPVAPVEPVAPLPPDPVIYPRNGQSAAQTELDRRGCDRWAMSQPNAMADASIFQRATLACMDGRGYTVR